MRKFFRLFARIVALLSVCVAADAASLTIRATYPDGRSVAGASVSLSSQSGRIRINAVTDSNGRYTFSNLAAGTYLVSVKAAEAYLLASRVETVRVEPDSSEELVFSLELGTVQESVVVTASGTAQTVDQVSKAITLVDDETLDIRDEVSISEALRPVPGVRVQQRGGPGTSTTVRMRGLRAQDTAVLIDGVRFRDAATTQGDASPFIQDLIATDAGRLEVLRGSGSSLYGTHAIGGVLNIVSRDGGGPPRGSALVEGGSLGLLRGRARFAGGLAGDRVTYSGGISLLDVRDGVRSKVPARNIAGQGVVRTSFDARTSLSVRLFAANSRLGLNESPRGIGESPSGVIRAVPLPEAELARYEAGTPVGELNVGDSTFIPDAADPDNDRESSFYSTLVQLERRQSARLGYELSYHGVVTSRSFIDGPLGVSSFEPERQSRSDIDGRIHTLGARLDYDFGAAGRVTMGYELELERFVNETLPDDPRARSSSDITQRSNALFLQDQLQLLHGQLHVSGALRAQFFALETPSFAPAESSPYQGLEFEAPENAYTLDGSIAYFVGGGSKLRSHVGTGYRAPSLFERFGTSFSSFGYSTYGDPRLRPERSFSVDAGLDQRLAGGRLTASATFFYTRLEDAILFDFGSLDPETDPFGRSGGYQTFADGGRARGLELAFSVSSSFGTEAQLGYTYADVTPAEGSIVDHAGALVIPTHQLSLVVTQRLGAHVYVNWDMTVSDSYVTRIFHPASSRSRDYRFDGITKVDLSAGYVLHGEAQLEARLFGKIDNLLDQAYHENGFLTPGRVALFGIAIEF